MRRRITLSDLAEGVIDALTSHICVLDTEGTIIALNRAWSQFRIENSPWGARSDIGANYLEVCEVTRGEERADATAFSQGIREVLAGDIEYFELEYPCHSPAEERWFLARVSPLKRHPRKTAVPIGAVVSHANITSRKLLEQRLLVAARTDFLTGLLNRRAFMEAASLALQEVQRTQVSSALIMFDVDDFKLINDTHGHDAGDEALRSIAATVSSQMRPEDIKARLGGEEFVALMTNIAPRDVASTAERLRRAMSAVTVTGPRGEFNLTVSVGVSSIAIDDHNAEQALRRADAALYRAKAEGKNRVRYDPGFAA
jgi:diguanylate cyclase (GGDEF)-like protein